MNTTEENIEVRHARTHNDFECGRCRYGYKIAQKQYIGKMNTISHNPAIYGVKEAEMAKRMREVVN